MKRIILFVAFALLANAAAASEPKSFAVRVVGRGQPMILIPGLATGGSVWDSTVEHFKDRYEIHVITLAGFAGQPRIDAPLLSTARSEIPAYIRSRKLNCPILVGHSLGGFLALAIAADEPKLIAAVVSVDGVPFLPALMNPAATVDSMRGQAESIRKRFAGMSPEQYAAQNRSSLASLITASSSVAAVAETGGRSHPAVVGEAVADAMTTDLRPLVSKIEAPVLLIGAGGLMPSEYRTAASKAYEAQIASIPRHRFVLAEKSRHFIMIDDPEFLFATMEPFLKEGRCSQ